MPRHPVPDDLLRLAEARRAARFARDWPEADRLKAMIAAAGWTIVDHGDAFTLQPTYAADVVETTRVRYGASLRVPSRLEVAAARAATLVLVATAAVDDVERTLAGLAGTAASDIERIVVANRPDPELEAQLAAWEAAWQGARTDAGAVPAEVVWLADRLGQAAALNAGIRRATGRIVLLVDTSIEPGGDFVTPLVGLLDEDPAVAVAGRWGLDSPDLRHFVSAGPGSVTAIDLACLAFRRDDYIARGPLDEHFVAPAGLDAWWSLVLRDEGDAHPARRAVALDLPVTRREVAPAGPGDDPGLARMRRRNAYRVLDRFGYRTDLAAGGASSARRG